jgi:hypothetical protein
LGDRALSLFVVGGRAQPDGITGWLSRRFFGGEPNDLVVALSSTMPASIRPSGETETDHSSYFSEVEMQKAHMPQVLDFIVAALAAGAAHAGRGVTSSEAARAGTGEAAPRQQGVTGEVKSGSLRPRSGSSRAAVSPD